MDLKKLDTSGLSKNDHVVLDYLIRNEERIFLESSQAIAKKTGVSNATIGRFWRKIGFKNIKDFQKALAQSKETTPASRIKNTLMEIQDENADISELLMKNMKNIETTIDTLSLKDIDKAANLLLCQRRIYIFAPDASLGIAQIMQYRLRRLGIEMIFVEGGSSIYEYLNNIEKEDLILIFCFSKILAETKILLDYGETRKVPAILFTDLYSHPLKDQAACTICSYRGEKKEYHSMVAPLSILDCIIITLALKKENTVSHMEELNRLRSEYQRFIKR